MVTSVVVMLPLTTYYLSVEEIGLFTFLTLIATMIMTPLNTAANLIINAYYFSSTNLQRKKLFFHLYLYELLLKLFVFCGLLLFGGFFLKLVIDEYKNDYYLLLSILSSGLIFTATRPILYHFLTVRKESKRFFWFNILEIMLLIIATAFFLSYMEMGLFGYVYATLTSSFVMFLIDINTIRKYWQWGYSKQYALLIYKKGIRLFYANIIETFVNFYDSFVVQKALDFYQLGIYSHAKQYVTKFGALDKAFFQAYSVSYMKMLRGEESLNIFKITLFWYSFLLFAGIMIIYFGEATVSLLTHDKMTESAKYIAFFYILVFFRSNQQQYSYQILYNKENGIFTFLSTSANILSLIILFMGVFVYNLDINFIVFSFVLNVILKNTFIKLYAIYKYKNVDISENIFLIFLILYLIIFFKEFSFNVLY